MIINRKDISFEISWSTLTLLSAIYIATAMNTSLWSSWMAITDMTLVSLFPTVTLLLLVVSAIVVLILTLSHPLLIKTVIAALLIFCGIVHFFSSSYGTIIDSSMMQNVLETDNREAWELINTSLFIHVFVYAVLPCFLLLMLKLKPINTRRWIQQASLLLLLILSINALLIYSNYGYLSLAFRQNRDLRMLINPTYPLYSLVKAANTIDKNDEKLLLPIGANATSSHTTHKQRDMLVVLVVGETARADHFSLAGYKRDTNSELAKRDDIIFFDNAWACGTSTAESLPCMFSNLTHDDFTKYRASERENLLDLLNKIGVSVAWIDNNSGSKGVSERTTYLSTKPSASYIEDGLCNEEDCLDEVLNLELEHQIEQLRGDAFIVLHQLGQHGPSYYKRYPDEYKTYRPECTRDDVYNCDTQSIINSYDNSLSYTDHTLVQLIEKLDKAQDDRDVIVMYMSDHGESLGENGVYLHGIPWRFAPDAQKHIPFLMWLSKNASATLNVNTSCLHNNHGKAYSHDNLFHTIAGIFTTKRFAEYKGDLDILETCRA